ncbi:MAG TPA: BTAD domain-containing putative transcriptional regulator, partial [Gaiellaceae bacterium]|nr:BTAD domain-containing putative transcriptional regulator [Gaiellaceae bacterium]
MTERLAVEANGTRVDEQRFPGRQGRIVFAYLAAQQGRPVPRDELADLLWGDELPATWEKALRVLMTKLRALLTECGIDGASALTSAFGCYQLTLPPGAWIDVHAAATAVQQAEAARAAGELEVARTHASTAAELARRVFLPGEDGPWVEDRRRDLRDLLVRALECLRDVALADGEFGEAVRYAAEITELEPFRESSYRALMQAHAAAGNPAEALRVYERCRRFLADELGAYPSSESEAVYRALLRS